MKLQLSYPLNVVLVSQVFGNKDQIYTNQGMLGHNGIDFFAGDGTPVYATHDGMASYQVDAGGGHGVVIISNEPFEIDGQSTLIKTIYWHLMDGLKYPKWMSPIADKTGFVPVKNGDIIGYADNTGMSTGTHLHFALKTVAQGETPGSYYNTQQHNGYFGCINPSSYFDGSTPATIQNLVKQISLLTLMVEKLKMWLNLKK